MQGQQTFGELNGIQYGFCNIGADEQYTVHFLNKAFDVGWSDVQ